jgi:hypothetical protein
VNLVQQRVIDKSNDAPNGVDVWAAQFRQVPRQNGIAVARAALEEARIAADAAEREWQAECQRLRAAGNQLQDAPANRAEAKAIAAKVRMRKAIADVTAAKEAAAPVLERHLQRHGAEGLALLTEALQQVLVISKHLASVADAAAADGASVNLKLQRARRVHVAAKHALAQLKP